MNIAELHKQLPEQIPAEISDQIQFFLRSNADQQMRFVIFLQKQIDFVLLQKALRLTIYAKTVFSYFYKEEVKVALWQKQEEIDASLLIDLIEVNADQGKEIDRFLTLEILPFSFPLVRARVIRNGQKDILCINMNHTPTDGSGLKDFVKTLSSVYTKLVTNQEIEIRQDITGDRSLKQVMDHFTFFQKLKFAKEGFSTPKRGLTWSFNWEKSGIENRKFITSMKIDSGTFERIKAYSKANDATINDIVLAAFIRSFESTNTKNQYAAKPVIVPFDLRKFVKATDNLSICSLTGSLICNIGRITGNSFNDTLIKVRDEMDRKKMVHAEMNMITQILVLSKLMSYEKLKGQMMNRKMPPIPLVTNVGIIDPEDINFNEISVEDAYITGAICTGDFFCMGYSTFKKVMTFSIGYTGGEKQEHKVKDYLESFKTELERIN
jgi:NRPS condensation-like uncharacterized protein